MGYRKLNRHGANGLTDPNKEWEESSDYAMLKRQITLGDGRYLIFYVFDRQEPAAESEISKQLPLLLASPGTKEKSGV
jgi:hypothetical protein